MKPGEILRAARRARMLRIEAAAEIIGCSKGYLYGLEGGRLTRPGTIFAANMQREFGVDSNLWDIPKRNGRRESDARKAKAQALRATGLTLQSVADAMGVSRQRVDQLVNPDKHHARILADRATASGKLVQPSNCEGCGRKLRRLFRHHEDYTKPLEVQWLCGRCHAKADGDVFRRAGRTRGRKITAYQTNHPLFLARNAAGLTLERLAVAVGISGAHRIADYERGKAKPRLHHLRPMSVALGVTVDEVLSWFEPKERRPLRPSTRLEFDAGRVRSNLISARAQKGLSQKRLAEVVGVSKLSIALWEAGVNRASSKNRSRLAEALDLSSETIEAMFGKAA